jgi:hypothetical protein
MLREPITINHKLVEEVVSREEAEFRKRTPRSLEMHERAKSSLPMGVSSSFQAVPPYPLFISHAVGSSMWTSISPSAVYSLVTLTRFW